MIGALNGRRRAAAVLGAIAVAAVAIAPATGAKPSKPQKPIKGPTIKVADDFYSPTNVKVKANTQLNYKWDSSNLNSHNVILQKGPKGVRKKDFKSATGSIGIRFKPVFEKKGSYDMLCTIHPTVMRMKVAVGK